MNARIDEGGDGTPVVRVKVPTMMRARVGGQAVVEAQGSTLGEVIADVDARYPGFAEAVIADGASLHRFVNLYLNDEDVRFLGALRTRVADGDVVSILPAVAGGAGRAPAVP